MHVFQEGSWKTGTWSHCPFMESGPRSKDVSIYTDKVLEKTALQRFSWQKLPFFLAPASFIFKIVPYARNTAGKPQQEIIIIIFKKDSLTLAICHSFLHDLPRFLN